jgi:iron complex transport system substrate-binding protein
VAKIAVILLLACGLVTAQPRRIVSTAPSITEMLFALGLGDRVVGVTTYCHYPEAARRITKIGSYSRPNLETILSLQPDLVIIQENPIRLAGQLKALHLKVLELDHQSVADIYRSIDRIAEAAGVLEQARRLNESIRRQLEEIRRRTAGLPRRRMMFIVGRTPGTLEGIIVAGKASYLNELIGIAGGENVFRDAVAAYPKVSLEEILARNPDVIVDMGEMAEPAEVTEARKRSVIALWNRYPSVSAVKQHGVFAVASDVFVVPGPRMVDAARQFAGMLHPEAGF